MVRPSRRREMAHKAVTERGVCIRVACQAFDISESCYRYERKLDAEVANWLMKLTDNHRSWGFGLCYLYLRNVKDRATYGYRRVWARLRLEGHDRVNLTHRVHKKKRKSPQKQGLQRKKKGDRESLSPVYGGAELTAWELSIHTRACLVVLESNSAANFS